MTNAIKQSKGVRCLKRTFWGKIQVEAGAHEYEECFTLISSIPKQRMNTRATEWSSVQKGWVLYRSGRKRTIEIQTGQVTVHIFLMLLKWGLFDSLCYCSASYLWHQAKLVALMSARKSYKNLWCYTIIKLTAGDDSEGGWRTNQMYFNQTTGSKE